MASIITSPNGSGQCTGNNSAAASPKNFVFSRSLISPRQATGVWISAWAGPIFANPGEIESVLF
jgi:hypothetical protein